MKKLICIVTALTIASCTLAPPNARNRENAITKSEPSGTVTPSVDQSAEVSSDTVPLSSVPSFMALNQTSVISNVQKQLRFLGHQPGRIDGVVGPQTSTALIKFQRSQGLVVTGQINQATLRALNVVPGASESASEVFAE